VGFFQITDKTPCRPRLKTLHGCRKPWRGGDKVQVIFHDDITEQREVSFLLQKASGVEQDLHGLGAREERQPVVDSSCHKVGVMYFQDAITASWHDVEDLFGRKLELPGLHSQAELGNEQKRYAIPTRNMGARKYPHSTQKPLPPN